MKISGSNIQLGSSNESSNGMEELIDIKAEISEMENRQILQLLLKCDKLIKP